MRFLRLTLRTIGFLLAVAVALPVMFLLIMQAQPGRTFVSSVVSSLASTDSQSVHLENLAIGFNLDASVDKVTLGDQAGMWLEINQVTVDWSPLRLLSGDLNIDDLSIAQVDLNRQSVTPTPESTNAEPAAETSDSGGFALPLNVDLAALTIGELNIGEDLAGTPISLTVNGAAKAATSPDILSANLDVTRIDGVEGDISAKAEFEPAADRLFFDIDVSEPSGGLVARLADIPDLPALGVSLKGNGPLTDWNADLMVSLDNWPTVTGSATLSEQTDVRNLSFDLDGDLAALAPPQAQAFVKGTTHAVGSAVFDLNFTPRSGQVDLKTETVSLTASGAADGETIALDADLKIDAGQNALIAVDLADRRVAFGPLRSRLALSGTKEEANWLLNLDVESLQTSEARTGPVAIAASGTNAKLQGSDFTTPFNLTTSIKALEGLIPATRPLTGAIDLSARGDLSSATSTVNFSALTLNTQIADLGLNETSVSPDHIKGAGTLKVSDLSPLSELAERSLGGTIDTTVAFDILPTDVSGTISLSNSAQNLQIGIPQVDALMSGQSNLSAALDLRGPEDVSVENLALKTPAMTAAGSIHYQPSDLVSDVSLNLSDLSKADPQLSGSVDASVQTSGPLDALKVDVSAKSAQILLAGTPLDQLSLTADAVADPKTPRAKVKGAASLSGQAIAIDLDLTSADGSATINPLEIDLAGNRISGTMSVDDLDKPLETLAGDLIIDAPRLANLSPLLLTEIGGRLEGTLKAYPNTQTIKMAIQGTDVDVPQASLKSLALNANLQAPYDPKTLAFDLKIEDLLTNATPIHSVSISAKPMGGATDLDADIKLESGAEDGLLLTATLSEPESGTYQVDLNSLALRYQGLTSALTQPTVIRHASGTTTLQPLELQLGNGSLIAEGRVGDDLEASAKLVNVPLDLANAFAPGLGLGGTLSGSANATGTSSAPSAQWALTASGITAKDLKANGLSALDIKSDGKFERETITQSTKISGASGLTFAAEGTIGIGNGIPLALTVNGTVPSAALQKPLLEAGLRAEGSINVAGNVSGTATSPAYQITATPSGMKVTSLSTGLTIQNIRGSLSADQSEARLNGIAADLATGGTLSASGSIGTKDGFPANLALNLNQARYIDPGLVAAEVNADIKVTGPLSSQSASALIGGTITINKADVSIPDYLPGAIPPLEVQHINASSAIRRQVEELGGGKKQTQSEQKANPPRLDVLLSAPGRIFVRGRGLDAELEGNLKVVGTTADPQAVGAFSLRRGQLDILTRRMTFSRGTATFEGSLTPVLDFAATTTVSDTTITVTVSGAADDPEIAFTSSPELPQDEVLALLLFGKSLGNLSATQVAQLAAAIATLTGGNDNGPLAQIRKSLGLDAIDVNTDGEDGPSVSVGKYINDNIYLGVEQGTGSSSSRVKVDIDLERGLKVRGEVGADGSSKAGIFFEREY